MASSINPTPALVGQYADEFVADVASKLKKPLKSPKAPNLKALKKKLIHAKSR